MFWLRGENMDLKVARELSGSGDPIRAAKFGDVDPLRKAYPQIAEYINLPLRKGKARSCRRTGGTDCHGRSRTA